MDPAERSNFLKQCRRNRRWLEFGREWVRPARHTLYRVRRRLLARGESDSAVGLGAPQTRRDEAFDENVADVFVENPSLAGPLTGTDTLFDEVDRQLDGTYRLAGGRSHALTPGILEGLRDFEDHHAYHRLYWAVRYAQAAALRHPQSEQGLVRDLTRWFDTDWTGDRCIGTAYTTSERIVSLVETLFWIRHGVLVGAGKLVVPIKRTLLGDAEHLAANVEYALGPHNHILDNARALYAAATALADQPQAGPWRDLSFELWDDYFPKLVMADGSFGEPTSFYLLMNCRTALEYLIACRRHRHEAPAGLTDRLERFLELGNELLRPDGSLPRFGDISPDHAISDLWGFLPAAWQLGHLRVPPRHLATTPLTIYYCGARPQLPESQGAGHPGLYPNGGWAFLRRPELGVELAVHADPRAKTHTHGDAGRGSFELWCRGQVLIRDPGNASYTDTRRQWYRSGAGQNVTCLNGIGPGISQEHQERLPAWYFDVQDGTLESPAEGGIVYRGGGFRRLGMPVALMRRWRWETPSCLAMDERLEGSGRFRFVTRLHLGDAAWTRAGAASFRFSQVGAPDVEMSVETPSNSRIEIRESRFAPEYGVEVSGRVLEISGTVTLPVMWVARWTFR